MKSVARLESEFAAWLGRRGAVAAGYGRAALALALRALPDAARSGEVLVPDFICAQVPEAVRYAGYNPVCFPVPRDLVIQPASVLDRCTANARAVIVPHYYGRVQPQIEGLAAACAECRLTLIEDCALAWGACLNGRRAGSFGDAAVFSFTKDAWCFSGGIVAADSEDWLAGMRGAQARLRPARKLAFFYGLLRAADFAANRPARSAWAEYSGRWCQRLFSVFEPRLRHSDFYDAGRVDARLTGFAARRALRLLYTLEKRDSARRRTYPLIVQHLTPTAGSAAQDGATGDSCAFLLLRNGRDADECVEAAARAGVTLRRAWPAYQEASNPADHLAWFANHLLILEVHPHWSAQEVRRIADTLARLNLVAI